MPNSVYIKNLIVQSIQWGVVSFSYFLMQASNKYYEGNLFVNYYLDAVAGIIGQCLGLPIYLWLGMRWTYLISFFFTLFFCVWIFVF